MLIHLSTRWFDVSLTSRRDRPEPSQDGGMFISNTASTEQLTYHENDAPTLGYRSRLKETT